MKTQKKMALKVWIGHCVDVKKKNKKQKMMTRIKKMKIQKVAINLIKANGHTTTKEVKEKCISKYSNEYWSQNQVSFAMQNFYNSPYGRQLGLNYKVVETDGVMHREYYFSSQNKNNDYKVVYDGVIFAGTKDNLECIIKKMNLPLRYSERADKFESLEDINERHLKRIIVKKMASLTDKNKINEYLMSNEFRLFVKRFDEILEGLQEMIDDGSTSLI